jgi:hypothetical protein
MQGRHRSPVKVHCEYIAKCPFVMFMQFLSRPCLSYDEKKKKLVNNNNLKKHFEIKESLSKNRSDKIK